MIIEVSDTLAFGSVHRCVFKLSPVNSSEVVKQFIAFRLYTLGYVTELMKSSF